MSDFEYTSTWETVNTNLQEIEKLLAQGKYNASMIKSRKTLEYMVKSMADHACIVDGDLSQMIDELYNGQWISKETREHYHQIRVLGNRAVNEENNNATDADRCYQILAQEAHVFSRPSARKRPTSSGTRTSAARKRKKRKNGRDLLIAYALRILVPLVILILVIFLATKLVNILSDKPDPTDPVVTTSAPLTIPATPEDTEATESTEATAPTDSTVVLYRAITTVNVRPEPNTAQERIGRLSPDQTVEFLRDYDDSWVVVRYNGQEAYVAK